MPTRALYLARGACRFCLAATTAVAPLAAQAVPRLQVAALPDRFEARVSQAPPGAAIALALDREPPAWTGAMVADPDGVAFARLPYPPGYGPGSTLVAQAIVSDGGPASAGLATAPRTVEIPRAGEEAAMIVLLGQSNAEGYARIEHLRADLRGPHPLLRIWSHGALEWQPAEAGVNSHAIGSPFFGPEIGIAAGVVARSRPVWLVKFTVSASAFGPLAGRWNEWAVGANELYPILLLRIDAAAAALRRLGYAPRVRLVCTMQGETDSLFPELALAYGQHLLTFCEELRSDLRARDLVGRDDPVIRIGLVSPVLLRLGVPGVDTVRRAQLAVARALPRCETVETADLDLAPDRIHFSAVGVLRLGRRYVRSGW